MSFETALHLPEAEYLHPSSPLFDPQKTILVPMCHYAVTSANSLYPIIGTLEVANCVGLTVFNPIDKIAAVNHEPEMLPVDVEHLLNVARGKYGKRLQMRVMGACLYDGDDRGSAYRREMVRYLWEYIAAQPDVDLLSFDVLGKAFPETYAIDSRNGSLFIGAPKTVFRGEFEPNIGYERMLEAKISHDNYNGLTELGRSRSG